MSYVYEENFNLDSTDEELVNTFDNWYKESESYHDKMLQDQKAAEQYYVGNQTNRDLIPEYKSDMVVNRIFESCETLVPLATSSAHQFLILPGSENELSVKRATNLQKVLSRKYETLLMQKKLEIAVRHVFLLKFGVLKYFWDRMTDDVGVKAVNPKLIYVPKLNVEPEELPYVIEAQDYSKNEIEAFFPEAEIGELQDSSAAKEQSGDPSRGTYRVWEVWTDEVVVWFSNKKVLDKRANPHFDFEGDEKPIFIQKPDGKRKKKSQLVFRNHLDRPEKPYAFIAPFNSGEGPLPEKGLADQLLPVQDGLNVQKRQIINNLRSMGNGQVLIDSDAMSQEESENITDEAGLIIRGKGVASENKIRREPGVPLPNAHFSNYQATNVEFDNIAGVHPATRGAGAAKTLGQDILSRQQDFSRVDLITRELNRAVAKIANGLVQLMKMYYTEPHVVKMIGEENAVEFVRLNQNDIEDYIEIIVKSGQTLPMDEVSARSEAVQLWQLQAIDPVTLFERLKFPNPEKAAERLQAWKMGQLTMETRAKIAEIQAGGQARMMGGGAKPGESGVETSQNVMQRATQSLGGTAPVAGLPNQ